MAQYKFFDDIIKKKGFKKIGEGIYGEVFSKADALTVVKLFGNDDCYVQFLHIIANHKNIKAFPKILSYGKFKQGYGTVFHIVKMEKLIPVRSDEYFKKGLNYIKEAIRVNGSNRNPDNEEDEIYADTLKKEHPDLYEASAILGKNHPGSKCEEDIHYGNIMKRANGDYVIIDPFA